MTARSPDPIAPGQAMMYRQIVESGNEGIWVFDLNGTTAYVNQRLANMLDYTVEEMSSISLLEVLDDVGQDQGADFLARQRRAGGTTESVECLMVRRGGEPIWTVVSHSPWQDEDGTYLGVIAFVNDITARRQLSDALQRREEQLAEAQRVARMGSWEWDFETKELHWSDEMYRIFHRSEDQLDGAIAAYLELLDPDDRERTTELVRRCLDEGRPSFEFEHRIGNDADHNLVWVRASGEIRRDDAGNPTLIRGTALDITAYKEAEEQLQRARDTALAALRAKSVFLATVSHEIRTPMNGVVGLTELLLATHLDDLQQRYTTALKTAGDALLSIINDILDFSKNESGAIQLELVDFDVALLLDDVVGLLARQAEAKGVRLVTRGRHGLAPLRGDPARLRQVLLNLTANAIKFTDAGEVVLSARLEASSDDAVGITFEVTDTGIGISAEDQQHIFEPFSQVDASTTRRFGGTGLGLAISRQLVEIMGGELTVDSSPGRGSAFAFTIQLLPAGEDQPGVNSATTSATDSSACS